MTFDPWRVLGIDAGADAEQIRDAWRRRVSEWHPDRNHSPDATARLQEINDAYASIGHAQAGPAWTGFPDSVLAGLSGTVFGRAYRQADIAPDCVRVELEIPLASWLLDRPVTLGIPLIDDFTTLVTLLHPGRLRDGTQLVFARAGLSATGAVTDLVVTMRVAAPALEPAADKRLSTEA